MSPRLPPATELVALLSRTPVAPEAHDRSRALIAGVTDWISVQRHAAGWDVEAVVASNLRALFADVIPPRILEALAERERECRAHSLARTLQTVNLVEKLEKQGIGVLVLKGPAIGVTAYDDPSLRPFLDIDLLVKRRDLAAARDFLLSEGYRREFPAAHEAALIESQHALEFGGRPMKVELHAALLSRYLRWEISAAEIWDRARAVSCAGGSIRVLAPEHLFLYLCAHGAKHEWERPRWICDVAQLMQRLDPDATRRVVELAAVTHSRRLLALAVRLTRDVLGVRDIPFSANDLVSERATRELVHMVRRRSIIAGTPAEREPHLQVPAFTGLEALIFWSKARERLRDRVACAAELIFVPTAADEGILPFAWARRPFRLAGRLLRARVVA